MESYDSIPFKYAVSRPLCGTWALPTPPPSRCLRKEEQPALPAQEQGPPATGTKSNRTHRRQPCRQPPPGGGRYDCRSLEPRTNPRTLWTRASCARRLSSASAVPRISPGRQKPPWPWLGPFGSPQLSFRSFLLFVLLWPPLFPRLLPLRCCRFEFCWRWFPVHRRENRFRRSSVQLVKAPITSLHLLENTRQQQNVNATFIASQCCKGAWDRLEGQNPTAKCHAPWQGSWPHGNGYMEMVAPDIPHSFGCELPSKLSQAPLPDQTQFVTLLSCGQSGWDPVLRKPISAYRG